MATFHITPDTTLVELTVGELVDAFATWGPEHDGDTGYARGQRDAARLLDALGAPESGRVLVAPWLRTEDGAA